MEALAEKGFGNLPYGKFQRKILIELYPSGFIDLHNSSISDFKQMHMHIRVIITLSK
jgi:hypothetical protein